VLYLQLNPGLHLIGRDKESAPHKADRRARLLAHCIVGDSTGVAGEPVANCPVSTRTSIHSCPITASHGSAAPGSFGGA
jgi:hypothetical protein